MLQGLDSTHFSQKFQVWTSLICTNFCYQLLDEFFRENSSTAQIWVLQFQHQTLVVSSPHSFLHHHTSRPHCTCNNFAPFNVSVRQYMSRQLPSFPLGIDSQYPPRHNNITSLSGSQVHFQPTDELQRESASLQQQVSDQEKIVQHCLSGGLSPGRPMLSLHQLHTEALSQPPEALHFSAHSALNDPQQRLPPHQIHFSSAHEQLSSAQHHLDSSFQQSSPSSHILHPFQPSTYWPQSSPTRQFSHHHPINEVCSPLVTPTSQPIHLQQPLVPQHLITHQYYPQHHQHQFFLPNQHLNQQTSFYPITSPPLRSSTLDPQSFHSPQPKAQPFSHNQRQGVKPKRLQPRSDPDNPDELEDFELDWLRYKRQAQHITLRNQLIQSSSTKEDVKGKHLQVIEQLRHRCDDKQAVNGSNLVNKEVFGTAAKLQPRIPTPVPTPIPTPAQSSIELPLFSSPSSISSNASSTMSKPSISTSNSLTSNKPSTHRPSSRSQVSTSSSSSSSSPSQLSTTQLPASENAITDQTQEQPKPQQSSPQQQPQSSPPPPPHPQQATISIQPRPINTTTFKHPKPLLTQPSHRIPGSLSLHFEPIHKIFPSELENVGAIFVDEPDTSLYWKTRFKSGPSVLSLGRYDEEEFYKLLQQERLKEVISGEETALVGLRDELGDLAVSQSGCRFEGNVYTMPLINLSVALNGIDPRTIALSLEELLYRSRTIIAHFLTCIERLDIQGSIELVFHLLEIAQLFALDSLRLFLRSTLEVCYLIQNSWNFTPENQARYQDYITTLKLGSLSKYQWSTVPAMNPPRSFPVFSQPHSSLPPGNTPNTDDMRNNQPTSAHNDLKPSSPPPSSALHHSTSTARQSQLGPATPSQPNFDTTTQSPNHSQSINGPAYRDIYPILNDGLPRFISPQLAALLRAQRIGLLPDPFAHHQRGLHPAIAVASTAILTIYPDPQNQAESTSPRTNLAPTPSSSTNPTPTITTGNPPDPSKPPPPPPHAFPTPTFHSIAPAQLARDTILSFYANAQNANNELLKQLSPRGTPSRRMFENLVTSKLAPEDQKPILKRMKTQLNSARGSSAFSVFQLQCAPGGFASNLQLLPAPELPPSFPMQQSSLNEEPPSILSTAPAIDLDVGDHPDPTRYSAILKTLAVQQFGTTNEHEKIQQFLTQSNPLATSSTTTEHFVNAERNGHQDPSNNPAAPTQTKSNIPTQQPPREKAENRQSAAALSFVQQTLEAGCTNRCHPIRSDGLPMFGNASDKRLRQLLDLDHIEDRLYQFHFFHTKQSQYFICPYRNVDPDCPCFKITQQVHNAGKWVFYERVFASQTLFSRECVVYQILCQCRDLIELEILRLSGFLQSHYAMGVRHRFDGKLVHEKKSRKFAPALYPIPFLPEDGAEAVYNVAEATGADRGVNGGKSLGVSTTTTTTTTTTTSAPTDKTPINAYNSPEEYFAHQKKLELRNLRKQQLTYLLTHGSIRNDADHSFADMIHAQHRRARLKHIIRNDRHKQRQQHHNHFQQPFTKRFNDSIDDKDFLEAFNIVHNSKYFRLSPEELGLIRFEAHEGYLSKVREYIVLYSKRCYHFLVQLTKLQQLMGVTNKRISSHRHHLRALIEQSSLDTSEQQQQHEEEEEETRDKAAVQIPKVAPLPTQQQANTESIDVLLKDSSKPPVTPKRTPLSTSASTPNARSSPSHHPSPQPQHLPSRHNRPRRFNPYQFMLGSLRAAYSFLRDLCRTQAQYLEGISRTYTNPTVTEDERTQLQDKYRESSEIDFKNHPNPVIRDLFTANIPQPHFTLPPPQPELYLPTTVAELDLLQDSTRLYHSEHYKYNIETRIKRDKQIKLLKREVKLIRRHLLLRTLLRQAKLNPRRIKRISALEGFDRAQLCYRQQTIEIATHVHAITQNRHEQRADTLWSQRLINIQRLVKQAEDNGESPESHRQYIQLKQQRVFDRALKHCYIRIILFYYLIRFAIQHKFKLPKYLLHFYKHFYHDIFAVEYKIQSRSRDIQSKLLQQYKVQSLAHKHRQHLRFSHPNGTISPSSDHSSNILHASPSCPLSSHPQFESVGQNCNPINYAGLTQLSAESTGIDLNSAHPAIYSDDEDMLRYYDNIYSMIVKFEQQGLCCRNETFQQQLAAQSTSNTHLERKFQALFSAIDKTDHSSSGQVSNPQQPRQPNHPPSSRGFVESMYPLASFKSAATKQAVKSALLDFSNEHAQNIEILKLYFNDPNVIAELFKNQSLISAINLVLHNTTLDPTKIAKDPPADPSVRQEPPSQCPQSKSAPRKLPTLADFDFSGQYGQFYWSLSPDQQSKLEKLYEFRFKVELQTKYDSFLHDEICHNLISLCQLRRPPQTSMNHASGICDHLGHYGDVIDIIETQHQWWSPRICSDDGFDEHDDLVQDAKASPTLPNRRGFVGIAVQGDQDYCCFLHSSIFQCDQFCALFSSDHHDWRDFQYLVGKLYVYSKLRPGEMYAQNSPYKYAYNYDISHFTHPVSNTITVQHGYLQSTLPLSNYLLGIPTLAQINKPIRIKFDFEGVTPTHRALEVVGDKDPHWFPSDRTFISESKYGLKVKFTTPVQSQIEHEQWRYEKWLHQTDSKLSTHPDDYYNPKHNLCPRCHQPQNKLMARVAVCGVCTFAYHLSWFSSASIIGPSSLLQMLYNISTMKQDNIRIAHPKDMEEWKCREKMSSNLQPEERIDQIASLHHTGTSPVTKTPVFFTTRPETPDSNTVNESPSAFLPTAYLPSQPITSVEVYSKFFTYLLTMIECVAKATQGGKALQRIDPKQPFGDDSIDIAMGESLGDSDTEIHQPTQTTKRSDPNDVNEAGLVQGEQFDEGTGVNMAAVDGKRCNQPTCKKCNQTTSKPKVKQINDALLARLLPSVNAVLDEHTSFHLHSRISRERSQTPLCESALEQPLLAAPTNSDPISSFLFQDNIDSISRAAQDCGLKVAFTEESTERSCEPLAPSIDPSPIQARKLRNLNRAYVNPRCGAKDLAKEDNLFQIHPTFPRDRSRWGSRHDFPTMVTRFGKRLYRIQTTHSNEDTHIYVDDDDVIYRHIPDSHSAAPWLYFRNVTSHKLSSEERKLKHFRREGHRILRETNSAHSDGPSPPPPTTSESDNNQDDDLNEDENDTELPTFHFAVDDGSGSFQPPDLSQFDVSISDNDDLGDDLNTAGFPPQTLQTSGFNKALVPQHQSSQTDSVLSSPIDSSSQPHHSRGKDEDSSTLFLPITQAFKRLSQSPPDLSQLGLGGLLSRRYDGSLLAPYAHHTLFAFHDEGSIGELGHMTCKHVVASFGLDFDHACFPHQRAYPEVHKVGNYIRNHLVPTKTNTYRNSWSSPHQRDRLAFRILERKYQEIRLAENYKQLIRYETLKNDSIYSLRADQHAIVQIDGRQHTSSGITNQQFSNSGHMEFQTSESDSSQDKTNRKKHRGSKVDKLTKPALSPETIEQMLSLNDQLYPRCNFPRWVASSVRLTPELIQYAFVHLSAEQQSTFLRAKPDVQCSVVYSSLQTPQKAHDMVLSMSSSTNTSNQSTPSPVQSSTPSPTDEDIQYGIAQILLNYPEEKRQTFLANLVQMSPKEQEEALLKLYALYHSTTQRTSPQPSQTPKTEEEEEEEEEEQQQQQQQCPPLNQLISCPPLVSSNLPSQSHRQHPRDTLSLISSTSRQFDRPINTTHHRRASQQISPRRPISPPQHSQDLHRKMDAPTLPVQKLTKSPPNRHLQATPSHSQQSQSSTSQHEVEQPAPQPAHELQKQQLFNELNGLTPEQLLRLYKDISIQQQSLQQQYDSSKHQSQIEPAHLTLLESQLDLLQQFQSHLVQKLQSFGFSEDTISSHAFEPSSRQRTQ